MEMIRLENIGVEFDGKWPLRDFNFTLQRGEFVILNGPNGSGKTTLLRVLLRLLRPTLGCVTYFNAEGKATKRLPIGYLPQKNNIDTRFPITVREAVESGARRGWLQRLDREARENVDRVIQLCGIGDLLDRTVGTLSGGQLQRTLLARALAGAPELLVLDEPLSYVDKTFEARLYEILGQLAPTHTILLVSHELTGLAPLATRIIDLSRRD